MNWGFLIYNCEWVWRRSAGGRGKGLPDLRAGVKRRKMTARKPGYIDLHGENAKEALEAFIEYYNDRVRLGNLDEIEVQHGWGSTGEGGGAIRSRLRSFLSKYPNQVAFERGSDLLDPYDSKTFVRPKTALPTFEGQLADDIVDYCENPKSEEKILGKFRRFGDPTVRRTLKDLVRQGSLQVATKAYKIYKQSK